ncbi:hypothetical protein ACJMK2_012955 [Sinanodonta woodiana]|uniref:Uncharacterized protein n=1 Tax=Sinanodonta woodiana TaxID=1069815 RepID=A0ABD3V9V9_SINWO
MTMVLRWRASNEIPWLVIPAMTLLSVAGIAILLTNLQMSNLFGPRRYTAMSSYVGAFYTGSITLLCMEMTNYAGIIDFQTSFMFITVGVVPILVSSIAFLPKSRVPWPLPADYGKNRYRGMEKDYHSQPNAWQRRISAGVKSRKDTHKILPVVRSPMYVWSVLWCCILNLKTIASEANTPLHLRYLGADNETVTTNVKLYYQLLLLALPFSPIFGILMDWRKRFVTDVRVEQMQNIQHALAITVVLSVCSIITAMIPVLDLQALTFILLMSEKVAMLASMFAFYTHVHFPNELLGKLTGIALMSSGIFSLLHFPLREFIRVTLRDDPFYVNLILLLLLVLSLGHPVCVWYHCKLNLIGDSSSQDMEHIPVTLIIEEEPAKTENKKVPSTSLDEKTGLQITDL